MKATPLISLGVLCDNGCTRQAIYVSPEKLTIIMKVTRNKQTGMWEVSLKRQQSEAVTINIMDQTTKPELAQYLHAALLSPTTARLLKEIKQGVLKTWPGITENLIKKHLEKYRNTKMVHLYMRE